MTTISGGSKITYKTSSGSLWDSSNTTSSTNDIRIAANHFQRRLGSNDCNESKAHSNEEKAFYHGLKSAYRMSRTPTGGASGDEYGTESPPWETAAQIAANVAIAFFETTDNEYTRAESFEYLEEQILDDEGVLERLLNRFRGEEAYPVDSIGPLTDSELEEGIGKAWTQVDDKWNHYDSARTALAIAEAYLGERQYER